MNQRYVRAPDGVRLHLGVSGSGCDVVMLSGGPGCVHYLEQDSLVPAGVRAWFPEPRGVGRSCGGKHTMAQAVDDLESIRAALDIDRWVVLGHSWGADLAVRYALDYPTSVSQVIGIAGHGLHKDRTWLQQYEDLKDAEMGPEIAWNTAVWHALSDSFVEWIHQPQLLRDLADSPVPMSLIAAGSDIRPPWPLQQLAALVPNGSFETVPGVPHDFWFTHPDTWLKVVGAACMR